MLKYPIIYEKDVPQLVKKCYNLQVTSVKQLNGYDDKNFYIETAQTLQNNTTNEIKTNPYILKILNAEESKNQALIEGQNLLMEHISKYNIPAPLPIKNINGLYLSQETLQSPENNNLGKIDKNIVRLLNFLPGALMKDATYSKLLLFEVGQLAGKLNKCFKNFRNEALEKREYIWKLESFPEVSKYLDVVLDKGQRELVESVLNAWKEVVEPSLPHLEKGIIHGDLNEQNILIDQQNRICGLLDLGDVSSSPCVFELGIAVMYVMLEVENLDPLEAAGFVVAGYVSQKEMADAEWNVLVESIAARFVQSLVLGLHSYTLNPENAYVLTSAKKGWSRLAALWAASKETLIEDWKFNCGQIIEDFGK